MELPDLRQKNSYDCGMIACRIVLRVLRRRLTRDLAGRLNTNPIDGTDPRAIESTLRHMGLGVIAGEMTIDDLRLQSQLGRPVICLVTRSGVGHYIVSAGVDCGRIKYQCPADGPCTISRSKFILSWRDVDRLGATYHQFGMAVWRRPNTPPTPQVLDIAEVERVNNRLKEILSLD